MNYRVALEALGLDGDDALTSDRVRRCYMRKLRQHPPERDPEGFRRLREAYELVKQLASDDDDAAPKPPAALIVQIDEPGSAGRGSAPEWERGSIDEPGSAGRGSAPEWERGSIDETPVALELARSEKLPLPLEKPVLPPLVPQMLPVARPSIGKPTAPLAVIVAQLLELLQQVRVGSAVELLRDWQSSEDADDVKQSNARVAARWTLVRELLEVAPELPQPVVRTLATAIAGGDLATARPALEAFRAAHPKLAEEANTLLVTRAPTLFAPLQHTLWVPRRLPAIIPPAPLDDRRRRRTGLGGGARGLWFAPVVLIAMLRLCSGSTSSYSPSTYPRMSPEQLERLTHPPRFDPHALTEVSRYTEPPELPPPLTSQSKEDMEHELGECARGLTIGLTWSFEQEQAARVLAAAVTAHQCADLRYAMTALESARRTPSATYLVRAGEYLAAMRARVDRLCPATRPGRTKPDATKRPATKPAPPPLPSLPTEDVELAPSAPAPPAPSETAP